MGGSNDMSRAQRGKSRGQVRMRRRYRGFTLIEILLVVALIGMFSAIFVVNLDALLRQSEVSAVESAFWEAAREARTRALIERRPQSLRFDEETMAFVVEEAGGVNRVEYPIDQDDWAPGTRLEIHLQKRVPPSQFSLVAGDLIDVRPIAAAHFFPDGTCSPFLVEMEVGAHDFTIEIDPWTGAELVLDEDA